VLENAREQGFRAGTLEALEAFVIMLRSFQTMLDKQNAYEIAVQVGKSTNIVKELFNDKTTEGLARYENIQELLNAIKEWVDNRQNLASIDEDGVVMENAEAVSQGAAAAALGSYLQQITLLTDADNEKEGDSDVVKLMTIHAAKGLEFPCVFVAGLEEGLFPNAMAINTREELEEERRLFYVAITRAKARLWLTYAGSRYRFGNLVQNEPSRFLAELPEKFLDMSYAGSSRSTMGSGGLWNRSNPFGQTTPRRPASSDTIARASKPAPAAIPMHTPTPGFTPDDPATMQEGMEVEHQKFGFGKILRIEGNAASRIATILFPQGGGEKKIMLNYAKLRIIKPGADE
jgi:DNA helicase-2/ATP-dependent DNA helicase PcrA